MATIKVNKDDKWINILAGSSSYTKEEIDKALTNVNKTIVTNIENSKTEINNNINNLSTNIDTKIEDTKTLLTDELNTKANKVDVYYKNVLYTKAEVDDRIAKAKPNIDLTPYATKEELNRFKPDLSNYVTHSELSKYTVVERLGLKDVTYNYNLKTNDVSEYSKIKRRHMNWNIDFKDREDKYHHFQFNVTAGKDIVINVEGTQEQDIRYTFTDGSSFCIKLIFKLKKLIPVGKNVSILERETIRPEMFIANNNELPDTVKHTFLDNYNTDQVGTITVGIKTTYLDNTFDITYCRLTINSRNIELEDYSSITADGVYTANIEKYYNAEEFNIPNNDKARKLIIPIGCSRLNKIDLPGWTNLEEIVIEDKPDYVFNVLNIKDTKIKKLNLVKFDYDMGDKPTSPYNLANHLTELKITLKDNNLTLDNAIKYIDPYVESSYDKYMVFLFNIFLKYCKENNITLQSDTIIFNDTRSIELRKSKDSSNPYLYLDFLNKLLINNKELVIFFHCFGTTNRQGLSICYNNNIKHLVITGGNNETYNNELNVTNNNNLEKIDFIIPRIYLEEEELDGYSLSYNRKFLLKDLPKLRELNFLLLKLEIGYEDIPRLNYNSSGSRFYNILKIINYYKDSLPSLEIIRFYTVYNKLKVYNDNIWVLIPKLLENNTSLKHLIFVNNDKLDTSASEEIRNFYPDIPEIPFACFRGCVNLREIIIMPTTKTIQTEAYTNCSSARYIHFIGTTPPTINGEPFKGVNCDMYVPDSAVDTYKTAYPQYASRIKPDSTLVLTDEEKLYN